MELFGQEKSWAASFYQVVASTTNQECYMFMFADGKASTVDIEDTTLTDLMLECDALFIVKAKVAVDFKHILITDLRSVLKNCTIEVPEALNMLHITNGSQSNITLPKHLVQCPNSIISNLTDYENLIAWETCNYTIASELAGTSYISGLNTAFELIYEYTTPVTVDRYIISTQNLASKEFVIEAYVNDAWVQIGKTTATTLAAYAIVLIKTTASKFRVKQTKAATQNLYHAYFGLVDYTEQDIKLFDKEFDCGLVTPSTRLTKVASDTIVTGSVADTVGYYLDVPAIMKVDVSYDLSDTNADVYLRRPSEDSANKHHIRLLGGTII